MFPLTNVEILHPITPTLKVDKLVHMTDNGQWRRVIKSTTDERTVTLKLRIDSSVMDTVLTYLDTNYNATFELNTPSVYPFGNNYTASIVRCLGYNPPVRESVKKWRLDVRFKQVAGIS